MREAYLSEVSMINPSKMTGLAPDLLCSFVPMEFVDGISGTITHSTVRSVREIEKGYTPFINGDVIFAKITPCMENGKCAITSKLKNGIGFGSTEFHVLRAGKDVLPDWIYYYLRQEKIRKQATRWFRGTAGQQRVPSDFLDQLKLPLPTITEQRRIAAILAKADRLRRLRRTARQLGETYLQSVFVEMFGDPTKRLDRWEIEIIEDVCELVRGSSPRPQGDPRYFGGPIPRLMGADITRDSMYVLPIIDSLTEVGAKQSRPMKAGDVVMVVSGNVGLPAILKIDACIHDGFVGFRNLNKKVSPVYFYFFLKSMQTQNQAQAAGAIWQNLTTDLIKEWRFPLPPLKNQERFVAIVQQYERFRSQQCEAERQAEMLYQSLLERAFAGEL